MTALPLLLAFCGDPAHPWAPPPEADDTIAEILMLPEQDSLDTDPPSSLEDEPGTPSAIKDIP